MTAGVADLTRLPTPEERRNMKALVADSIDFSAQSALLCATLVVF